MLSRFGLGGSTRQVLILPGGDLHHMPPLCRHVFWSLNKGCRSSYVLELGLQQALGKRCLSTATNTTDGTWSAMGASLSQLPHSGLLCG